jgi:hypothetical protein
MMSKKQQYLLKRSNHPFDPFVPAILPVLPAATSELDSHMEQFFGSVALPTEEGIIAGR